MHQENVNLNKKVICENRCTCYSIDCYAYEKAGTRQQTPRSHQQLTNAKGIQISIANFGNHY